MLNTQRVDVLDGEGLWFRTIYVRCSNFLRWYFSYFQCKSWVNLSPSGRPVRGWVSKR
jgi:hypothetical protein